jgi:hypothetical protein
MDHYRLSTALDPSHETHVSMSRTMLECLFLFQVEKNLVSFHKLHSQIKIPVEWAGFGGANHNRNNIRFSVRLAGWKAVET